MTVRILLGFAVVLAGAGAVSGEASAEPEAMLGRWELFSVLSGSPWIWRPVAPGERQQIDVRADAIVVWGREPDSTDEHEPTTFPIEWTDEGFAVTDVSIEDSNPGILPFSPYFSPVFVSYSDTPEPTLGVSPWVPDIGVYAYKRVAGVVNEPTSFGKVKALY